MTKNELVVLLKDVPLDNEHEIKIHTCKGRVFYDKTRDVIALTDDEKHVVGGIWLMSEIEIQIYMFSEYEGQGYMSNFMRSGALNREAAKFQIPPVFSSSVHIDPVKSLCVQKMEKRYYLCQLANLHISNERELILTYVDVCEMLIRQVLKKNVKHYLKRPFRDKFQRRIYESTLIRCLVGRLLFDQAIPFAKMDNYDCVKDALLQLSIQKFTDCLWDFVNSFGDMYVNSYEIWSHERNVSKLSYSRGQFYHHDGCWDIFTWSPTIWIGIYLYVKEKMEHLTLVKTFTQQHLEDMVYQLRMRYRVEHGYSTDDCYRYVKVSHQFVKGFD